MRRPRHRLAREMSGSCVVARTRIGLAGAGWVTEHHLDAYRKLQDRASVVAIADPRLDAARERARQYEIPAAYGSVHEMLEREDLDALDIAAPREHHVPLCRLAMSRSLAALCQKPLAPTLAEAEALVAELEAEREAHGDSSTPGPEADPGRGSTPEPQADRGNGSTAEPQAARGHGSTGERRAGAAGRTRLMVHDNWRFRPHYRRVHAWIREGRIGTIRGAFMSNLTSGLLPDADGRLPALVRQPMLAGLERMLLMEVMIHHVDALRFLLGPLTLDAARLGKRCEQIRGEDRVTLLLATRDGAPVSLVGDFMAHGRPPEQVDRLEILGTEGSIRLRGDTLRLIAGAEEIVRLDLQSDYEESYRGAIGHFLDRIADGGPFETTAQDHLETLRIVEAAYQAELERISPA